mmetsp:Transcript_75288/g.237954  ORF Transcript_75288/g.237954 Transcript_75288/m.237954 type:complete len:211 (+) Transcript_75288:1520-2152(+)
MFDTVKALPSFSPSMLGTSIRGSCPSRNSRKRALTDSSSSVRAAASCAACATAPAFLEASHLLSASGFLCTSSRCLRPQLSSFLPCAVLPSADTALSSPSPSARSSSDGSEATSASWTFTRMPLPSSVCNSWPLRSRTCSSRTPPSSSNSTPRLRSSCCAPGLRSASRHVPPAFSRSAPRASESASKKSEHHSLTASEPVWSAGTSRFLK